MYLGAHSLDQIIFGCFLGLAFLIMYKFKFQEFLYEVVGNSLNQKHKKVYFIFHSIIFIIFLILPIIFYQLNMSNRPVNSSDIININTKCSKNITEGSLKASILIATTMGFVPIGLFFGILALPNKDGYELFYMLGRWKYTSIKAILYIILSIIVISGVPAAIFCLVIPKVSSVVVLNFISTAIGAVWGGFSLVYFINKIQKRY